MGRAVLYRRRFFGFWRDFVRAGSGSYELQFYRSRAFAKTSAAVCHHPGRNIFKGKTFAKILAVRGAGFGWRLFGNFWSCQPDPFVE